MMKKKMEIFYFVSFILAIFFFHESQVLFQLFPAPGAILWKRRQFHVIKIHLILNYIPKSVQAFTFRLALTSLTLYTARHPLSYDQLQHLESSHVKYYVHRLYTIDMVITSNVYVCVGINVCGNAVFTYEPRESCQYSYPDTERTSYSIHSVLQVSKSWATRPSVTCPNRRLIANVVNGVNAARLTALHKLDEQQCIPFS